MAINDKPCFDVLFRNVMLLPCCYSLEKLECMTPYGNRLAEGGPLFTCSLGGRFVYVSKCREEKDHQRALCSSLALLLLIEV